MTVTARTQPLFVEMATEDNKFEDAYANDLDPLVAIVSNR